MPVQPLVVEPIRVQPAPVKALSYTGDATEPLGWVVMKLLVLMAALVALMGLFHSASALWVHFNPKPFNNISTWARGTLLWVVGPIVMTFTCLCNGLVLAGVMGFFRRWRAARLLMLWGAAGVVSGVAALFVLESMQFPMLRTAGYDLRSAAVLTAWRVQWMFAPLAVPVLLMLVMARAEVKRWMAVRRLEHAASPWEAA